MSVTGAFGNYANSIHDEVSQLDVSRNQIPAEVSMEESFFSKLKDIIKSSGYTQS